MNYAYLGLYGDYPQILSDIGIDEHKSVMLSDYDSFKERDKESAVFELFFPAVVDVGGEVAVIPGLNEGSDDFVITDYRCDVPVVSVFKNDLSGREGTAVVKGSILKEYAKQFYPELELHEYESLDACMETLEKGNVRFVMMTASQAVAQVFSREQYSRYQMQLMDRACTVAVVTKGANSEMLAAHINRAIREDTNGQLAKGAILKYLHIQKEESKLNVALIVGIFVLLAVLVIIYFVWKQLKQNRKEQTFVINCLSSDFECVTLVDLRSSHETRYRISELFTRLIPGWAENNDFSQRMRMFADKLIVEEDRKRFLQEAEKERIAARLRESDTYVVNYKINIGGSVQYFQTKFVHNATNRHSVIAGFHNVDAEVRKELELQAKIRENAMVQRLSMQMVTTLVKVIEAKDKYTNGHSVRVAAYAREIAKRSGLNEKRQREIYYMGLLHDIGKIGLPDELVNKTGRLSDEEFAVVKTHPVMGARILENITEMPKLTEGALHHHEHYDGHGYPDAQKGSDISQEARILCVADAYDAMSSPRSFRDALTQEKIIQ